MTNQPSTSDLTNQLRELAKSLQSGGGGKDLRMSEAGHIQLTAHVNEFRDKLHQQRQKAAGNIHYGSVGNIWSAVQTKSQFENLTDAAVAALDGQIALLDEFNKVVDAAFKRMQAEDNAV